MGCWDCGCVLCGGPPRSAAFDLDGVRGLNKITDWMNKCTMLLPNGDVIHKTKEVNCNISFQLIGKGIEIQYSESPDFYSLLPTYGLFVHEDCYKYAAKKLGSPVTYLHFPVHKIEYSMGIKGIKYPYLKYQSQFFDYKGASKVKNLLQSPLKDNKLDRVLSQLKLTKDRVSRPSPPISATLAPKYSYAFHNNKIWSNSAGRWTPVPHVTKVINLFDLHKNKALKQYSGKLIHKFYNYYRFSYSTSENPLFVTVIKPIKKGKYDLHHVQLHLVTTEFEFEEYTKLLDKMKLKYELK